MKRSGRARLVYVKDINRNVPPPPPPPPREGGPAGTVTMGWQAGEATRTSSTAQRLNNRVE